MLSICCNSSVKSLRNTKWHYFTLKTLSSLLREITLKNNGDFYCLNCRHSFRTKNKIE